MGLRPAGMTAHLRGKATGGRKAQRHEIAGCVRQRLKLGSATPATIAAASWLDLWYNETALNIPGAAEVLGAIGRRHGPRQQQGR
jgi:hypothetical protein